MCAVPCCAGSSCHIRLYAVVHTAVMSHDAARAPGTPGSSGAQCHTAADDATCAGRLLRCQRMLFQGILFRRLAISLRTGARKCHLPGRLQQGVFQRQGVMSAGKALPGIMAAAVLCISAPARVSFSGFVPLHGTEYLFCLREQKKRTAKHHVPPCAPCEFLLMWSRPAAGQSGTPARRHPGQRPRCAVRRPAPVRQKPEPAKGPWPGRRPGSSCQPRYCS